MENSKIPLFSVSDFIAVTNQTLEYAFPIVSVEGEVSSFKVNQNKYVFFDLKDATGSISCFMTVWQLRQPIEDGMKIIVSANPKLTEWGKFSLTVKALRPSGEGNLKRSADLLRTKLEKEGLFALERKRPLPKLPGRVAVISSIQAAGYADFIKIINDRFGGLKIDVAQVQVQGKEAPDQIIRALQYFNAQKELPEVIIVIRGGGSADDLSVFNDEPLVRALAASRVPTLVGIGHETDMSLADLVADVRAATPSNAAQLLVPDKHEVIRETRHKLQLILPELTWSINQLEDVVKQTIWRSAETVQRHFEVALREVAFKRQILAELDPNRLLARGYAIISGLVAPGEIITIKKSTLIATAEVKDVKNK